MFLAYFRAHLPPKARVPGLLIFKLYQSEVKVNIKYSEVKDAPKFGSATKNSRFWMNDLVLSSKEEKILQKIPNIRGSNCMDNELTVNT